FPSRRQKNANTIKLEKSYRSGEELLALSLSFFIDLADEFFKFGLLFRRKDLADFIAAPLPYSIHLRIADRVNRFVLALRLIEDGVDLLLLLGGQTHITHKLFPFLCPALLGGQLRGRSGVAAVCECITQDRAQRTAQHKN